MGSTLIIFWSEPNIISAKKYPTYSLEPKAEENQDVRGSV